MLNPKAVDQLKEAPVMSLSLCSLSLCVRIFNLRYRKLCTAELAEDAENKMAKILEKIVFFSAHSAFSAVN